MYFKLIDVINSIAGFQLVIFSFFLLHKGRKSISNNILAAFFIVQFIVIFNDLLISLIEKSSSLYVQIAYLYCPFTFLWGPLIYFYVKSQLKQGFRFKFINIIHLVPFIFIATFIISNYYASDIATKRFIISNSLMDQWFFYFNIPYFLLLFAYNFSALYHLFTYQQNLKDYYSYEIKQKLVWLKFVLFGYIIACIVSASAIFSWNISIPGEYKMNILFGTFLIFFNILFYRAMIQPHLLIQPGEKPKYSGTGISTAEIGKYAQKLTVALNTNKVYLNPTLTLNELSEVTQIPERIISQVINQHWKQNFFSFINSHRVEEAKILLNSFDQNKSTMLGVADDSGFNSKSAFYDAFKKHTGMTPTEYRNLKA